jgi:hypothetical protein
MEDYSDNFSNFSIYSQVDTSTSNLEKIKKMESLMNSEDRKLQETNKMKDAQIMINSISKANKNKNITNTPNKKSTKTSNKNKNKRSKKNTKKRKKIYNEDFSNDQNNDNLNEIYENNNNHNNHNNHTNNHNHNGYKNIHNLISNLEENEDD